MEKIYGINHDGDDEMPQPESNIQPVEDVFPKAKLVRKFYSFYKFFHRFSIIISVAIWVIWLVYFALGTSQHSTAQYNAAQYYTETGKIQQIAPFYPHWSVPVVAAFILILGLFLSYVSIALCKWVENMKK